MLVTRQSMVASDFDSIFFIFFLFVSGYQLSGYQHSSKYLLLHTNSLSMTCATQTNLN